MDAIQAQLRMDEGIIRFEWTDTDMKRHTFNISPNLLMILMQQGLGIAWSYFKLVPRG